MSNVEKRCDKKRKRNDGGAVSEKIRPDGSGINSKKKHNREDEKYDHEKCEKHCDNEMYKTLVLEVSEHGFVVFCELRRGAV